MRNGTSSFIAILSADAVGRAHSSAHPETVEWLFLTLGSMLLWGPGILIPFIAMPEGELCLRSYLRLWGLLYFCLLPSAMLHYSVKTKDRPLLIAALLSLLMNFGYISLCAFLFTVCKAM